MGFDGAHLDVGNANNHPLFDKEAGGLDLTQVCLIFVFFI
jgi:hypothetical protein